MLLHSGIVCKCVIPQPKGTMRLDLRGKFPETFFFFRFRKVCFRESPFSVQSLLTEKYSEMTAYSGWEDNAN